MPYSDGGCLGLTLTAFGKDLVTSQSAIAFLPWIQNKLIRGIRSVSSSEKFQLHHRVKRWDERIWHWPRCCLNGTKERQFQQEDLGEVVPLVTSWTLTDLLTNVLGG